MLGHFQWYWQLVVVGDAAGHVVPISGELRLALMPSVPCTARGATRPVGVPSFQPHVVARTQFIVKKTSVDAVVV